MKSHTALGGYAEDGRYASATEQVVEEQTTAVNYARMVLDEAKDLANHVQQLVDRLLGETPQAVASRGEKSVGSGVLPSLQEHASRVRDELHGGASALRRLERAI